MTPEELHTHAIEAEKHVEQLATGLAQGGAPDQAVKAVSNIANSLREVAKSLGKPTPPAEHRPSMDDAASGMRDDMHARTAQPPANY